MRFPSFIFPPFFRLISSLRAAVYLAASELIACVDQNDVAALLDSWEAQGKLPSPPDPDVLTGCNPLPPPPPPSLPLPSPTPLSRTRSQSPTPLIPSLHLGSNDASSPPQPRVRIAPVFSTTALRMLPELEGMKGAELVGADTAELSFRDLVDAEAARRALDGTYCTFVSLFSPPVFRDSLNLEY